MNQARPRPAATAQAASVRPASTTVTAHITKSCQPTGSAGSTNCGRKAVKNAIVFGLVMGEAARYVHAVARRNSVGEAPGRPPALDAEPDQIGRAGPPQDFKHFGGCSQDPVQAERDAGEQRSVAERGAYHRDQRRAGAARRAGCDHQRHDRTRHDHQDQGDEEEGREEVIVHE